MSGIYRFKKAGFVLLASLMMSTSIPAFAQQEIGNAPLPEVEVDGSVLQQLDPSAGTTPSLNPIMLTPSASLNRQATTYNGPTLTDTLEMDPSGAKDIAIEDALAGPAPSAPVVARVIVPANAPPTFLIETRTVAAQNIQDPVQQIENNTEDEPETFLQHFIKAPVSSIFGSSRKNETKANPDQVAIASAPEVSAAPSVPATGPKIMQAGTVSARPSDLANEDRPASIPRKKMTPPAEGLAAKPAPRVDMSPVTSIASAPPARPAAAPNVPDSKIVTEVVMDVPGVAMPKAPLQPVPKKIAAAAKTIIPKIEESVDLTAPPKVMEETAGLKAAVTKPVMFPISSKSKTRGDINPEITKTSEAKTPIAPVIPHPDTKNALNNAMSDPGVNKPEQVSVAVVAPKQAAPEVLYQKVPVPKARPNVIVASKDFVEQARRTYEDTYKVVKRDGDRMPAISAQQVAKESLPPARSGSGPVHISVADIASDPLASKLVAMTPDDIASTLNSMAPAAGNNAKLSRAAEENIVSPNRVRIVRENGNWLSRKPQESAQTASAGATGLPAPSSDGRYNIAFQSGATDLPATSYGDVDSGIVIALRSDSNARVQIIAYASASDGKDTTAKRTSLARALSLRSYMISKGIDATRMDVRAMGVQQDAKAAQDQVQMIIVPADPKKS
ncbi:MAG: nicotinate-nucleotide-dimethylbenzimidazole phosphoribosyltransferase [Micavibrio sp.]|nr:nicotinate-nucleotide-dimethylbenzimidazole phosphoribosyltransferase [Micavibrio sp.]